jgi:hypothetical protein
VDISQGGIGLVVGRQFAPGTPLTILLKSATDAIYEFQARVVNCTRQADGDWLVGCQFSSQLRPDQLQALL